MKEKRRRNQKSSRMKTQIHGRGDEVKLIFISTNMGEGGGGGRKI